MVYTVIKSNSRHKQIVRAISVFAHETQNAYALHCLGCSVYRDELSLVDACRLAARTCVEKSTGYTMPKGIAYVLFCIGEGVLYALRDLWILGGAIEPAWMVHLFA